MTKWFIYFEKIKAMKSLVIESKKDEVRVNFLSRFFGIFSEEIVKNWCSNPNNKNYTNIGRPTIHTQGGEKYTLDFYLQNKKTGKNYIVEQKSFYGYKKGKLSVINQNTDFISAFDNWSNSKQQRTKAWEAFLSFDAKRGDEVKVAKTEYKTQGKILIWSSCKDNETKKWFCKKLGIDDILTLEEMIIDLVNWKDIGYKKSLLEKKKWVDVFIEECLS